MDVKLLVVGGRVNKDVVPVLPPSVLGRSKQADLTLAHPMISRKHCEVFEQDGLLMIRDLGSLNGTMINGHRIKEAPLPPGAEFTIGPLTFRAEYKYKGKLSALPAIVPDASVPAEDELAELQPIDPAPSPPAQAAAPSSGLNHDDDFALLKGLSGVAMSVLDFSEEDEAMGVAMDSPATPAEDKKGLPPDLQDTKQPKPPAPPPAPSNAKPGKDAKPSKDAGKKSKPH